MLLFGPSYTVQFFALAALHFAKQQLVTCHDCCSGCLLLHLLFQWHVPPNSCPTWKFPLFPSFLHIKGSQICWKSYPSNSDEQRGNPSSSLVSCSVPNSLYWANWVKAALRGYSCYIWISKYTLPYQKDRNIYVTLKHRDILVLSNWVIPRILMDQLKLVRKKDRQAA